MKAASLRHIALKVSQEDLLTRASENYELYLRTINRVYPFALKSTLVASHLRSEAACPPEPQNAARAPHRSPLASNTLSNARKSKRGAKRCSYTGKKTSRLPR